MQESSIKGSLFSMYMTQTCYLFCIKTHAKIYPQYIGHDTIGQYRGTFLCIHLNKMYHHMKCT